MKTMYFVAHVYGCGFNPTIVESVASYEDAIAYINILKNKGKEGEYVVLTIANK